MKEFFELKLDNQTIDEYEQKFLELLKYVPFIKDESCQDSEVPEWITASYWG
jgi:hypothetical protein